MTFYPKLCLLQGRKGQSAIYMEEFRNGLERSAFGVCEWLGDQMGIRRSRVRLYFIYLSCLSMGSSRLFYFFAAFWLNVHNYMREGKRVIGQ